MALPSGKRNRTSFRGSGPADPVAHVGLIGDAAQRREPKSKPLHGRQAVHHVLAHVAHHVHDTKDDHRPYGQVLPELGRHVSSATVHRCRPARFVAATILWHDVRMCPPPGLYDEVDGD